MPKADAIAAALSSELASARQSVGAASERRASIASSRGSRAGSALRAGREGMHVLRGLEDCDVQVGWGGWGNSVWAALPSPRRPHPLLPPQSRAARQASLADVASAWRARSAAASANRSGSARRPTAGWATEISAAADTEEGEEGEGDAEAAADVAATWAVRAPAAAAPSALTLAPGRLGRDAFGLDRAAPLPPPPPATRANPWEPLLQGHAPEAVGAPLLGAARRVTGGHIAGAAALTTATRSGGGAAASEADREGAFLAALLDGDDE